MSLTLAALLTAAVLAVASGILSLLEFDRRTIIRISASWYDLATTVVTFLILFALNGMFFAWWQPVFHAGGWLLWALVNLLVTGLVSWGFDCLEGNDFGEWSTYRSPSYDVNWPNLASWFCLAGIVVLLGLGAIKSGFFNTLGQERATQLVNRTHVETPEEMQRRADSGNRLNVSTDGQTPAEKPKPDELPTKTDVANYPPTDERHVPIVLPQVARYKAEGLLDQDAIGTRYSLVVPGEVQVVNGELQYIFTLTPRYRWNEWFTARHGEYYITVSAENPDAAAKLSSKRDIACYAGGRYGTNIERAIYRAYPSHFVSGLSPEVSDDGTLHYTASLNRTDVRWDYSTPVKAVVVNAETCKVKDYDLPTASDPGDLPIWVDRVFGEEDAAKMMDWYGRWSAGPELAPYRFTGEKHANRMQVAGDPNLVFTNHGPALQIIMVGRNINLDDNKNAAAQKIILMDTRTGSIRIYPGNGVRIEESLKDQFKDITVQGLPKGVPDRAGVYVVHGEWVWVGGMVSEDKAGSNDSVSFGGIGLVRANGDKSSAIIDKSWGQVLARLDTLPEVTDNNDPTADKNYEEIPAQVTAVKTYIEGGFTKVVYKLAVDGKPDEHYYVAVIGRRDALGQLFVQEGDKVIMRYTDDGSQFRTVEGVVVTTPAPAKATTASR